MKTVFTQIISLSISASLIACLVMLLRLVLKKSPRFIVCALWALVAVRLLVPALPESKVSLMPHQVSSGSLVEELAARPVESTLRVKKSEPRYVKIIEKNPQIPVRYQGDEAYVEVSEKTLEAPKTLGSDVMPLLAWIWLGGAALMLAYMGFSYFRIWRKVGACLKRGEGIYICDNISSPFILGIIRPKIYLPSSLKEENKAYVIAHEEAHLKRLDHLWKPLGYFLLSLHWFNPLLWAAYILLCRDIEMACDEKVTGREGRAYRQAYSEALLACSAPARLVTACPLAFGEVGVKTRIRSVLNHKKPAFWILILTLLACAVAAGCALTNRESADPSAYPGVPGSEIPATNPATTPAATSASSSSESVTQPVSESSGPTAHESSPETAPPESESREAQPLPGKKPQAVEMQEGILQAIEWARFEIDEESGSSLYRNGRGPEGFENLPDWQGWLENYEGDLWPAAPLGEEVPEWVKDLDTGRLLRIEWPYAPERLTLCGIAKDEQSATIYDFKNNNLYVSYVDMRDWLYIPESFICGTLTNMLVMAPLKDGLVVYTLESGIHEVSARGTLEDVQNLREEILRGRVAALNEGKTIGDDYPGFLIDLDGNGRAERISLEKGVGNRNALAREFYVDGKPAGTSWLRYHWGDMGMAGHEILWPDEGTFSREAEYKLYLASLDGEHITLFLESHEQTYGLSLIKEYYSDEGFNMTLRTRLRGLGKSMAEFAPCRSLEQYIAEGWLLRPEEGDELDLSGDGVRESMELELVFYGGGAHSGFPYAEVLRIADGEKKILLPGDVRHIAGSERAATIIYEGFDNAFANESGLNLRYGDLYYLENGAGGYDLIGELSLNGRTLIQRYQLTDEEWKPLEAGGDLSRALFRNIGGMPYPYPGWEGVDEAVRAYFDKEAQGHAQPAGEELAGLQKLFRNLFAGHFLLDEYEDVRDIDLSRLFYDGVTEDSVPRVSAIVPSEEERAAVAKVLGGDIGIPLMSVKRGAMEEAFLRYTAYPLAEARGEMPFTYLEAYDAYYFFKGDTANRGYSVVDAFINEDGSVTALWRGLGWEKDAFGLVTLRKTEEGWQFLSNRFLKLETIGAGTP